MSSTIEENNKIIVLRRKSLSPKCINPYISHENNSKLISHNVDPRILTLTLDKIAYCAHSRYLFKGLVNFSYSLLMIPLIPVLQLIHSGSISVIGFFIEFLAVLLIACLILLYFLYQHKVKSVDRTKILLSSINAVNPKMKYDITFSLNLIITIYDSDHIKALVLADELNLAYIVQPKLMDIRSSLLGNLDQEYIMNPHIHSINKINKNYHIIRKQQFEHIKDHLASIGFMWGLMLVIGIIFPVYIKIWDSAGYFLIWILSLVTWFISYALMNNFSYNKINKEIGRTTYLYAQKFKSKGIIVDPNLTDADDLVILIYNKDITIYDDFLLFISSFKH